MNKMIPISYILLALIVVFMYGVTIWMSSIENFDNEEGDTFEDPEKMYDDTYASVYDLLWHSNEKLQYERVSMQDITLADWPKDSVHVLDMCCGTAPHACWFRDLGVDYDGVDISEAMIKKARDNCPSAKISKGDVTQVHLFPPKSKTHCLLMNFAVYQFPNPKVLSDNAYQWLQPDGYFIVHAVDPDKFDPILDLATPFAAFSLQKYALGRQTESNIYFDKFKYTSRLNKGKDEDDATFEEIFTYYDKDNNKGHKYRENKHRWVMPSKERLINIIQSSGFRFVEAVHLINCAKEYQFLLYFKK